MGCFALGRVPLGHVEYSSGAKLPIGKLDPRIGVVSLSADTPASVVLHDIAYGVGKRLLVPCQDPMNPTLVDTSVKDLQFYVRNPTSTQEQSPITVPLTASGWTVVNGSLADDAQGLKITADGAGDCTVTYTYGANQNWGASPDNFLSRWIGNNAGRTLTFILKMPDAGNQFVYTTTDNAAGLRQINQLMQLLTKTGSPSLSTVKVVSVKITSPDANETYYLNRVGSDVCPSVPVKKASMEFYLDNTAEETANPAVISDDNQTSFWSTTGTPVLSNDTVVKAKGVNSLKIDLNGGVQWDGIKTNGYNANWSGKDFIAFYWYGSNSGNAWRLYIQSSSGNFRTQSFTDNWIGQRRLVFSILAMSQTGTLDLTAVNYVALQVSSMVLNTAINYLDRVVLDVGTWAKVEVAVPDVLHTYNNYLSAHANVADWNYWTLTFWDGSVYADGLLFESGAFIERYFNSNTAKFLNASTLKSVYGETQDYNSLLSATALIAGFRGHIKTRVETVRMANQSIIYSQVGTTKNRLGFAVKMPPSDLRQSSTYGFSQVKLKLEVYCT